MKTKRIFKQCSCCGRNKEANDKNFYTCTYGDGLRSICKECTSDKMKQYRYKKVTGKLDVLKEIKAPKINTVAIEKAILDMKEMENTIQYRINNFNKVKLQRNISIILNVLIIGASVAFRLLHK